MLGAATGTLALGGCGSEGDSGSIDFWNIGTAEPLKTLWPQFAEEFESTNDVTIDLTTLENDAFKSKLTTVAQSGSAPDIFHSWGGGTLAEQVEAGLVRDLTGTSWLDTITPTSLSLYEVDGKNYGVPFDLGMITFWYNKQLFSQAGIDTPPTTWSEFLESITMLKGAGITPIALAGQDKWPGHYYWAYLAMRLGGSQLFSSAMAANSFSADEFVQAGELLKQLVDLEPFQKGFLSATYSATDGQAATVANGNAAMELMGQWAPSTQAACASNGVGLGDDLAFFPFPTVDGAPGLLTDAFGGGNGYAVGKDAPDEAVAFLEYISKVDQQRALAESGAIIPVVADAVDALTDANQMKLAEALVEPTDFQLYLDQAFPAATANQVNDSVAQLIAGEATPSEVAEAITAASK